MFDYKTSSDISAHICKFYNSISLILLIEEEAYKIKDIENKEVCE